MPSIGPSCRRVLAAVLFACTALAVPAAQQKPTFRAGVEIIAIDVNVVDRTSRPVGDLKADDFAVTVDRKPRKIVSAEFLRYDVSLAPLAGVRSASAPPRPLASPAPPRNVLLVIDDDNLEPGNGLAVKRAASAFLDRFGPNDRFAVVTIPWLRREVVFTRDRAGVRKSLDAVLTHFERYPSGRFNIGLAEAMDAEHPDMIGRDKLYTIYWRECQGKPEPPVSSKTGQILGPGGDPCWWEIQGHVKDMQLDAHLRGQRSLEALRDLGEAATQIPGPKTVLLITGGVPAPDTTSWYSDVEAAFNRGQMTLYTLYIEQWAFGMASGKTSPTADWDPSVQREGMEHATSAAGGIWMHAVGTLDQYFDRVAAELSGSYLLGIEVEASDRDGRPHQVQVKVNRKDVDVRARKQYVIEANATKPDTRKAVAIGTKRAADKGGAESVIARLAHTPSDLVPVIERCGEYVAGYEEQLRAISAVERSERTLSTPKGDGTWAVATTRRTSADLLLLRRAWAPGWQLFRDVFEVDGKATRPHDDRLRKLLTQSPDDFRDRARTINEESARYELDVVRRETNPPNSAMLFLHPSMAERFVFLKVGEEDRGGTLAWKVAYEERRRPTLVQGPAGDLPAEGILWLDPNDGRLLAGLMRVNAGDVKVEITVTYGVASRDDDLWVPSKMTETYTSSTFKLEIASSYSRFMKIEAGR